VNLHRFIEAEKAQQGNVKRACELREVSRAAYCRQGRAGFGQQRREPQHLPIDSGPVELDQHDDVGVGSGSRRRPSGRWEPDEGGAFSCRQSGYSKAVTVNATAPSSSFLAAVAGACWTPVRKGLEEFLDELLQCRALETIATGYLRLRVRYRWLQDEEIAAKRIRRAFIEGSRSGGRGQGQLIRRPAPSAAARAARL
jgi:hypothetical protein